MPLTHEVKRNNGECWTTTTDAPREQLRWNSRHDALRNEFTDSPWLVSDEIDSCAHLAYHGGWTETFDLRDFRIADQRDLRIAEIRARSEHLQIEFDALSKRWNADTRHMSLISEKITHPAHLRIIGMGEAAIPLILKALRDKPTHWFTALRATTNTDPATENDNPATARAAWLEWGIKEGYID